MKLRHELKKLLVRAGYYREPDFLIIGAQKAGTTFLYSYLSQHPMILRPAFKEPHFFDWDQHYRKGKVQYFKNFELPYKFSNGQLTFEATVDTLYVPQGPERVRAYLPDVKLIAILRDPVSRAFSQWNMGYYHKERDDHLFEERSFEQVIEDELRSWGRYDRKGYLKRGLYSEQLKRVYQHFSEDQVLVLDHGTMKKDLSTSLERMSEFLGISLAALDKGDEERLLNENKASYKDEIPRSQEERLRELFQPYDDELVSLMGRKFSWM